MATITVQQIDRDGLETVTGVCSFGGDEFANDELGRLTFVFVKNTNIADRTIRFTIQKTVDGEVPPKKAVVVPAGEERRIGPFPFDWYNDTDGRVQITYSAVTDLAIAVMRL